MEIDHDLINRARTSTRWWFGNKVLYDLCRDNPSHDNGDVVLAKIWLIGRSYAAAIERGPKRDNVNDDFYMDVVVPGILNSNIDDWIYKIKHLALCNDNLEEFIETHSKVTNLFFEISKRNKRSLASKYLHFHLPKLFFIYDSRAVNGISRITENLEKINVKKIGDSSYRKFSCKCLSLRNYIECKYGQALSPRQIDNLLLSVESLSQE